jgi:hypothetical protein
MDLVLDDITVQVSLNEVTESPSPFSGRLLKGYEAKFKVYEQGLSNRLNGYLKNGSILSLVDDSGSTFRLELRQNSYSFQAGSNSGYSYSLLLDEVEELRIEKLVIGEIEFSPYSYKEQFENGAIIITAKVELNLDDIFKLKNLMVQRGEYFNVVRVGISDEAKEMRFGAMLEWAPAAEGAIRQSFILVEKAYDANVKPLSSIDGRRIDNLIRESIRTKMLNALLVEKLKKAGLIDENDLVEMDKVYEECWRIERFSYYEQDSIDNEDDE